PGLVHELLALGQVRTHESHDHWHLDLHLLVRLDHDLGDDVDPRHSAEDVDQDRLHRRVFEDDLERVHHPLGIVHRADVEEVGGLAASELNSVHGRHGKGGDVHDAADVPL